jgi:hypothetical protein
VSSAEPGLIELRVREWNQIFNSFDPSPFHEQDLAREAEEYIVDSLKELPTKRASEIRVHLAQSPVAEGERALESAIHTYFGRRALHLRRTLRDLIRDGVISLLIGLTVLVVFFVLGEIVESRWGESRWGTLARESLLIGGWVAMWRPLEIFLYSWWPMVGRRRMYEHLSRVPVRLVATGAP